MKKFALIALGLLTATAITASAAPATKAAVSPATTNAPATKAAVYPATTNAPAEKAVVVVPAVKAVDPVAERAGLVKELEGTTSSSRPLFGSLGSSGGSSNPSTLREEQEGPQRVLAARGFLATQAGGKLAAALTSLNVSDRLLRQVLVENYNSTTLKGWCDPKGGISPAELAELRKHISAASLYLTQTSISIR